MSDTDLEPLVVSLDLDETLIHTREFPFQYAGETFLMEYEDETLYSSVRPGARALIEHLFAHPDRFIVGIFTVASPVYAQKVIEHLFTDEQRQQLAFVRDRRHVRLTEAFDHVTGWGFTESKPLKAKDLSKVRRKVKRDSRSRIIALDDSVKAWPRTYGNVLPVPEFNADTTDDRVMRGAISALDFLSRLDDVRPIEKRGMVIRHANKRVAEKTHDFS